MKNNYISKIIDLGKERSFSMGINYVSVEMVAIVLGRHIEQYLRSLSIRLSEWETELSALVRGFDGGSDIAEEITPRLSKIMEGIPASTTFEDAVISFFKGSQAEGKSLLSRWLVKKNISFDGIKISDVNHEVKGTSAATKQEPISVGNNKLPRCVFRELVSEARANSLPQIFGRDQEIQSLVTVLCKKEKRNALLLGDPGVGKTALVEGLAQRIAEKNTPPVLHKLKIYEIRFQDILFGGSYAIQDLKNLLKDIGKSGDILFLDEIHQINNKIAENIGLADLFKPYMARDDLRMIGASTTDEYSIYIRKDPALERRFERVVVRESGEKDTVDILLKILPEYTDYYNISVNEDIIKKIVRLSIRYFPDRRLPDKAKDLLNLSLARIYAEGKKQLDIEDVIKTISIKTGLPEKNILVSKKDVLNGLKEEIETQIFGQEDVIEKVMVVLKRYLAGFKPDNKPAGSFLFVGPSGVGKTALARIISNILFGGKLIRIDLSEYKDRESVNRLIGSPPGYVGHDSGGELTNYVIENPQCVVLLDEVEKASADISDIFLQVLDGARLTDGRGRIADFNETVVIMTSNLGHSGEKSIKIMSPGAKNDRHDDVTIGDIKSELTSFFRVEFLNRIDSIVPFKYLKKESLILIVQKELMSLKRRAKQKGHILEFDKKIVEWLVNQSDKTGGARAAQKSIQDNIFNKLIDKLSIYSQGVQLNISVKNNEVAFDIIK